MQKYDPESIKSEPAENNGIPSISTMASKQSSRETIVGCK